mmetsp:Transcript_44646/g.92309  ORF Transcript_44646/g.92309 Transcript_44646/m.92309 type:complete len:270 (-) Transcript_44646:22-831(-)
MSGTWNIDVVKARCGRDSGVVPIQAQRVGQVVEDEISCSAEVRVDVKLEVPASSGSWIRVESTIAAVLEVNSKLSISGPAGTELVCRRVEAQFRAEPELHAAFPLVRLPFVLLVDAVQDFLDRSLPPAAPAATATAVVPTRRRADLLFLRINLKLRHGPLHLHELATASELKLRELNLGHCKVTVGVVAAEDDLGNDVSLCDVGRVDFLLGAVAPVRILLVAGSLHLECAALVGGAGGQTENTQQHLGDHRGGMLGVTHAHERLKAEIA